MAFNYEIKKHIGTVSESGDYATEVNMISYNGAEPKLDIRSWNKTMNRMGKGITIRKEDVKLLKNILEDALKYLEEEK